MTVESLPTGGGRRARADGTITDAKTVVGLLFAGAIIWVTNDSSVAERGPGAAAEPRAPAWPSARSS